MMPAMITSLSSTMGGAGHSELCSRMMSSALPGLMRILAAADEVNTERDTSGAGAATAEAASSVGGGLISCARSLARRKQDTLGLTLGRWIGALAGRATSMSPPVFL